jgi:hypothetical protein
LKILTLLRKCLVNSLKNSSKHRLGNETMLQILGMGYLKTKQGHGLLFTKLLQTHNSLKIIRLSQFWQPRGMPGVWMGVKKKKGERGIYS